MLPNDMLLPMVLTSGLLDGINPCAFAVMGFLVAFLFALGQARAHVLQVGTAYIVGMYLTYFAIGLGVLTALASLGLPHIVAKVGAGLVIALGLVQLKDVVFPRLPFHLRMPAMAWEKTKSLMYSVSLPSALALGGLVGLCTLPCSGGIYLAVLSLLGSQATYLQGVGYLALYNLMFVAPLVAILLAVGNRPVARGLAAWERRNTRTVHLVAGLAMVALGVVILAWAS
ncbi:MAG: cytochrome c biogenesis protein CcdA [Chloroflexi bacterium]|nr:cytochrome c biogenesis protein CcdA [Chloroflexota bacterium]